MPKCDLQSNFIETALRHGCSPVNLLLILKIPFVQNTSGWLFLEKSRWEVLMKIPAQKDAVNSSPKKASVYLLKLNFSVDVFLCIPKIIFRFSYFMKNEYKI